MLHCVLRGFIFIVASSQMETREKVKGRRVEARGGAWRRVEFPVLARHSKIFRLNFRKTKQTNVNASSKQREDCVSVVCRKGSLL